MDEQKINKNKELIALKTKLNRTDLMINRLQGKVKGLQRSLKLESKVKELVKKGLSA